MLESRPFRHSALASPVIARCNDGENTDPCTTDVRTRHPVPRAPGGEGSGRPSGTVARRVPSGDNGDMRSVVTLAGTAMLGWAAGCGTPPNRIYIQTFSEPAAPRKYLTDFTEAYFARSADGGVDILLRWNEPAQADPTQYTEQIVHAHSFWTPVLGTTRAEASMINASLRFMILTPPTGVGYEGAGFLSFQINRAGDTLEGRIESGELSPRQVAGGAKEPFGPARIEGRIRAVNNRRQLLRLLHEAERKLRTAASTP